jgi:deoxycytidylate deaminase
MNKLVDTSTKIALKLNSAIDKSHRHFAFIFLRNKLLSIGQNNMESTSVFTYKMGQKFNVEHNKKFPYIHAEIDAISRLWGKTHIGPRMTLVSLRLDKHGEYRRSKPCVHCSKVLDSLGLTVIYFDEEFKCKRN